jgi:D-alanine-D-alanine ligase
VSGTDQGGSLDVVLLLDDAAGLTSQDSTETFLFVADAVDAIEAALRSLGPRPRRLSFEVGVPPTIERLTSDRPDVVFVLGQPVPDDPEGEAQVAALLDLLRIPHTSESFDTLVLARDKPRVKMVAAHHRIPVPAYAVCPEGVLPAVLPPAPWIVKPALEHGSRGIECATPATNRDDLAERVRSLHTRFQQPVLVDTFIDGREFQVGIVGPDLLPVLELDFSALSAGAPKMIGYATKWHSDSLEFKSLRYECPARVDERTVGALTDLARSAIAAFGLRRCSRLDIRMDADGELYLLYVNPNPDLSPMEAMPVMAQASGRSFNWMVQRLLDLALQDRRQGHSR